jgi:hypothetical protein
MSYCLYTRQGYKDISFQRIRDEVADPESYYAELADIATDIPPNGCLNAFFKKFIRPILLEKKLVDHKMFEIYREDSFVPWLR